MIERFFDVAMRDIGKARPSAHLATPFGLNETTGWEWYVSQDVLDDLITELRAQSMFTLLPPVGTPPTPEMRIIGLPVVLADKPYTLVLRVREST